MPRISGRLALAVAALALSTTALAQGRGPTAAQARAYIYGAFLTQAAPGILSERVKLGPELEQRLKLPAGASSEKVYEALISLTDGKRPLDVRRATDEELTGYGMVPGLDIAHPSYALIAGNVKLLVQYDLQANAIPFVGQFDLRPPAKPAVAAVAARQSEFNPKKPSIVTLVWTESFEFNRAGLNEGIKNKLDTDILPKLKDFADIRYINVNGHSDLLGSPGYNQGLSEKRAEAVRDYLVAQGADASKIEVYGYGKTLPLKSCKEAKGRRELIECLAPNRRVQIEIQGLLK